MNRINNHSIIIINMNSTDTKPFSNSNFYQVEVQIYSVLASLGNMLLISKDSVEYDLTLIISVC